MGWGIWGRGLVAPETVNNLFVLFPWVREGLSCKGDCAELMKSSLN